MSRTVETEHIAYDYMSESERTLRAEVEKQYEKRDREDADFEDSSSRKRPRHKGEASKTPKKPRIPPAKSTKPLVPKIATPRGNEAMNSSERSPTFGRALTSDAASESPVVISETSPGLREHNVSTQDPASDARTDKDRQRRTEEQQRKAFQKQLSNKLLTDFDESQALSSHSRAVWGQIDELLTERLRAKSAYETKLIEIKKKVHELAGDLALHLQSLVPR